MISQPSWGWVNSVRLNSFTATYPVISTVPVTILDESEGDENDGDSKGEEEEEVEGE